MHWLILYSGIQSFFPCYCALIFIHLIPTSNLNGSHISTPELLSKLQMPFVVCLPDGHRHDRAAALRCSDLHIQSLPQMHVNQTLSPSETAVSATVATKRKCHLQLATGMLCSEFRGCVCTEAAFPTGCSPSLTEYHKDTRTGLFRRGTGFL